MMLKCFHAVAVVYGLAVVAVGAEQQFRWTRPIELPVVSEVSLFAAPLDSAVYAATRDGLPDLRTQSADGKPVAMLLRKAMATKDRTIRKTWSATIGAARMQEGGALTVEWSLGDKDPAPQGLRILTPLRDFEHQVRVEASADGKTWEPIAPATAIATSIAAPTATRFSIIDAEPVSPPSGASTDTATNAPSAMNTPWPKFSTSIRPKTVSYTHLTLPTISSG